jgi:hypothetical protein
MEKIGFVIVDEQIEGRLFADGVIFRNKKEVVNQLVDFHSIDWCGEDTDMYATLEKYILSFKSIQQKLDWILDYGGWSIQRIKINRKNKELLGE